MREINELFERGMEIVRSCGIEPFRINSVKIDRRSHRKWGQMKMYDWTFDLYYNEKILDERIDENFAMSVIVHEILHCVPGGMNHGAQWKQYAERVMEKYPELNISVTSPPEVNGVNLYDDCRTKYVIRCTKCGKEYIRLCRSKLVKHPERYRCQCGGRLRRVKNVQ